MNPNVPSFPTCQRLAAAGWQPDRTKWGEDTWMGPGPDKKPFDPYLGRWEIHVRVDNKEICFYDAPSLAEMLAEIARRKWGIGLEFHWGYPDVWHVGIQWGIGLARCGSHENPTEALALALAAALEAEGAKT
jgi:hypothetical protein